MGCFSSSIVSSQLQKQRKLIVMDQYIKKWNKWIVKTSETAVTEMIFQNANTLLTERDSFQNVWRWVL